MVFTILNVYGQLCFDPSLIFSTENLPQTEPAVTVMISTLRVYLATTLKRNELQTLIDLCHARFAKKQNFLDRKSGTNNIVSKDYLSMMVFHKSYESEDCWKARNAKKQSKISTGRTHKICEIINIGLDIFLHNQCFITQWNFNIVCNVLINSLHRDKFLRSQILHQTYLKTNGVKSQSNQSTNSRREVNPWYSEVWQMMDFHRSRCLQKKINIKSYHPYTVMFG